MYKDVQHFVTTCESFQVHSMIQHRDELLPSYPPTIHFKWMVDLVTMLVGLGQVRYLVLARENLTNQVEGRALRNKTIAGCMLILDRGCNLPIRMRREDHGRPRGAGCARGRGAVRPTRGQAKMTTYNPKANGKVEHEHGPIVKAIVRAYNGRVRNWPRLLPYALWADRITHSSITRYMPTELMFKQKPIMSVEQTITSWMAVDWAHEVSREELLATRIR